MLHTMKKSDIPIPDEPVAFRPDAIVDSSMVNAFTSESYKAVCRFSDGKLHGSEIQTYLRVDAWVRNIAFRKDVFVDLHVFDGSGTVLQRETRPLGYLQGAGGGGDFFQIDSLVYRGTGGLPDSIWPRADARLIEYRLYYGVGGQLYSDGVAHRHELKHDVALEFATAKAA